MDGRTITSTDPRGSRLLLGVAAALTFLLVAVPAALAAFVPTDRYEASATVGVRPDSTAAGSWQLASFLLPSVQADATSRRLRADVLARVAGEVPEGAVWTVETGVEPGTGVLDVTVTSTDREVVAPVADTYARTLVAAYLTDPALDLRLIDSAEPPSGPSSPDRALILATGLALGLLLSALVALLLHRGRRGPGRDELAAAPDELSRLTAPYPVSAGTGTGAGLGAGSRTEVLTQRSGGRPA
jgi:capsular polysaccharide biosynthesis protein